MFKSEGSLRILAMRVSITIAILVSAIGIMTALGTLQLANGAPQAPHGTCGVGDGSSNGAFGCAGNVGGFIQTPGGRCIEQNTPNSVFSGSCS